MKKLIKGSLVGLSFTSLGIANADSDFNELTL